jgi:hypothetical protein
MIRVRQMQERFWEPILALNFLWRHLGEGFPRQAGELGSDAGLNGLAARHGDVRSGPIAQIVTSFQQRLVLDFIRDMMAANSSLDYDWRVT